MFLELIKDFYPKNEKFFKVFKKLDVVSKALGKMKDRISWRKPDKLKKFHYDLIEDNVCWFEEKKKGEEFSVIKKKRIDFLFPQ